MRPSSCDENEEASDLPVSLRTAMQSLRMRPVPREALERSLTRAMALDAREATEASAVGRVHRPVRPWRGRLLRGALVVTVALLAIALVPTAQARERADELGAGRGGSSCRGRGSALSRISMVRGGSMRGAIRPGSGSVIAAKNGFILPICERISTRSTMPSKMFSPARRSIPRGCCKRKSAKCRCFFN